MRAPSVLGPPSSTTSRFALLALTAAAATAYVQQGTATLVVPQLHLSWFARPLDCALHARDDAAHVDAVTLTSGFGDCLHRSTVHDAILLGALVAVTLGAAVLMYLVHPVLLSRGRWRSAYDVSVLAAGSRTHADLLASVTGALDEYGLADRVSVRISALSRDRSGRTYGLRRRYVIVLSLGLAVPQAGKPNLLPGVLRHELAHIRNRDIGMTYLTLSLWWAFVGTAALPAVVLDAVYGPGSLPRTLLAVAIALTVLWWERAAVFRAREHHADIAVPDFGDVLRASGAGRSAATIRRRRREPPLVVLGRRLRTAMTYHPPWPTRAEVYQDPGLLLRAPWSEAVMAGVLVGFGYPPLWNQIRTLWPTAWVSVQWALGGMFGALVAGIVGLGIWRVVWRRRTLDGPRPRPAALGACFSVGLLAGQFLVPAQLAGTDAGWRDLLTQRPLTALAWAGVLVAASSMMLSLQVLVAERWLGAGVSPRRAAFFAAVAGGALLGPLLLGYWMSVLDPLTKILTPWSLFLWVTAVLAIDPVHVLLFVLMFLLPAAAELPRTRRLGLRTATARAAAWLWRPALIGLGAAALFTGVGFSLHAAMRTRLLALEQAPQLNDAVMGGTTSAFLLLPVAIAGVMCIVVVCGVAEALRRYPRAQRPPMRARFAPIAASAAVAAPLVSLITFWHLDASVCTRGFLHCTNLPGWNTVAGVTVWDFALAVVPALLITAAICGLGAWLSQVAVRRTLPAPLRVPLKLGLAGYSALGLAAFVLALGYFIRINTISLNTMTTPKPTLRSLAADQRPGLVRAAAACYVYWGEMNRADEQTTLLPADVVDAEFVRIFGSSDNLVLQRLAAAGLGSLLGTNTLSVSDDFQLINEYCALVISPTELGP